MVHPQLLYKVHMDLPPQILKILTDLLLHQYKVLTVLPQIPKILTARPQHPLSLKNLTEPLPQILKILTDLPQLLYKALTVLLPNHKTPMVHPLLQFKVLMEAQLKIRKIPTGHPRPLL